jgi:hypothetical protein
LPPLFKLIERFFYIFLSGYTLIWSKSQSFKYFLRLAIPHKIDSNSIIPDTMPVKLISEKLKLSRKNHKHIIVNIINEITSPTIFILAKINLL